MSTRFKVGDRAVYSCFGLVTVARIETKVAGSATRKFYVLKTDAGVTLMLPVTDDLPELRPVITSETAERVLALASVPLQGARAPTWNRRYREYMEKLKSGYAEDTLDVYRALRTARSETELSFGERKMLDSARNLLNAELSVALNRNVDLE